ncbi:MAG: hypothetical protein QOC65_250 [Sphingomonadales bacterium]|nr:hypothetical protein [Sphingomonadales bacterium]
MVKFLVVVREPGQLAPDYSLEVEAPTLPREGDYLSVQRPDHERPFGEDMIVAKVWWRRAHPGTGPIDSDPREVGGVDEIFVECVAAVGPWSCDWWRDSLERVGGPALEVSRLSVRESELAAMRKRSAEARGRPEALAGARVGLLAAARSGPAARLWSAWKGFIRIG